MLDIHPFEKAGLGKAPFQYRGMSEKVYVAYPGASAQPAGTCDYCGNGIRYCCHIQSAEGKQFIVGTDCVRKTDRVCAIGADRDEKARERKQRAEKRQAIVSKENERAEAAFACFPEVADVLASQPHPAFADKTLRDYVEYLMKWAGHSGRLRAARLIEKARQQVTA